MFLKKLKIDGFKSFAKPVTIDFQSPITALVGPNGSGKSNIVDAIRWALGEQSAKTLRGGKMADVIFAGSDDCKPLKKASVTLYFDNSDQTLASEAREIKISRQVTEDGQSDYLLNGSLCRLKDIEELMMDTGMGKDSYSIVGQGKIDSILNSKPEKLRELFEEAAGISKYKMRKDEAEKRLDKTKQDLQRVKDLIWELDKQLNPLKKAAEKARKYERFHHELKELEVNLLLDKWSKNSLDLNDARAEKEIVSRDLNKNRKELDSLNGLLEVKKNKLEVDQDLLDERQADFYQLKIKKEQVDNNLKVLAERKNGLNRERLNLKEQIGILQENQEDLHDKIVGLNDENKRASNQKAGIKDRLSLKEDELLLKKEKLNQQKEKLLVLRESLLSENVELTDIHTELEKVREKSYYLEKEIENLIAERKGISEELDMNILQQENINEDLNSVIDDLSSLNENIVRLDNRINESKKGITELQEGIDTKDKQLQQMASRLHILENMEEDYQGYFQGVRGVLKNSEVLNGVIGVVADQIKVNRKFETAIETALGAKLQNLIVEDDESAQQCVNFLKREKAGRATFLPLNMINGKRAELAHYDLDNVPGFLGLAVEFISFDSELTPVFNYLLGRIIIASDLKAAREIAKKIRSSFRIVTLDGEVISPGGAISGGSRTRNKQGLLARGREIEELREKIGDIKGTIEIEERKKEELLVRLEQDKKEKEGCLKEINKLKFTENDLEKDLSNFKKEQLKLENKLENLDQNFVKCHETLGETDNRKQKIEQQLELINRENDKGRDEIFIKEKEIAELERLEEEIRKDITELKVELATVKQKEENLLREKNSLQEQREINELQIKKFREKVAGLNKKEEVLKERKTELVLKKEEYADNISSLQEELEGRKKDFTVQEEDFKGLKEKHQIIEQTVNEYNEKNHKLALKITRLEDRNEQIEERLSDEYDLSAEEGIGERIEIKEQRQAANKIAEFKEAIKRLGTVNTGAVMEYNELKDRLGYLRDQEEDLLKARDAIVRIIDDIKDKMAELFHLTFQKVKTEFEKTFSHLFNGGKARLNLTKTDNLLETGVEIEAQPPGKQLKKLSLMSGGERALTAIALVFAFLKVNPSPIYILDEIDAPLDDANVLRFANYIREYSAYVQFMLITHNKKMMTQADAIYGITMEERGVSKLVSLRFDEGIA
ncbi:MAG: chromosome segregation protein SMC [Firmicutes bacterium]|nr:chromosome segregation protein SMC [Bacillota bacterium]